MSCNQCATQSQAMLATAGVPAEQVQATFSQERKSAVWEYLPRCPHCKKWVSPRSGICNYRHCSQQGQQVHEETIGWPPPQAQWVSPAEARLNRRLDADNATGRVVIADVAGIDQLHDQTLPTGYERSDIARHQARQFADQVHQQFGTALPGSRHSLGVPYDNFTYAQVREYAQMWQNIQDGAWEQANQDANGRLTEPTEVMVWSRTRDRNEPMTLHYRNAREVDVVSASGRTHRVQNHSGHTECSCEDYQYRHAHRGTHCRHIEAVNNNLGNLPESIQGIQDGVIPADGREQVQEQIETVVAPILNDNNVTDVVSDPTDEIRLYTSSELSTQLESFSTEQARITFLNDYVESLRGIEFDYDNLPESTSSFSTFEENALRYWPLRYTREILNSNDLSGMMEYHIPTVAATLIGEIERSHTNFHATNSLETKLKQISRLHTATSLYMSLQKKTAEQDGETSIPEINGFYRHESVISVLDSLDGFDTSVSMEEASTHTQINRTMLQIANTRSRFTSGFRRSNDILESYTESFIQGLGYPNYTSANDTNPQGFLSRVVNDTFQNGNRRLSPLRQEQFSLTVAPTGKYNVVSYSNSGLYQNPESNRFLGIDAQQGILSPSLRNQWGTQYSYRPHSSYRQIHNMLPSQENVGRMYAPNIRGMAMLARDLSQDPQYQLSSAIVISSFLDNAPESTSQIIRDHASERTIDSGTPSPGMDNFIESLPERKLTHDDIERFKNTIRANRTSGSILDVDSYRYSEDGGKSLEEITQLGLQALETADIYSRYIHGNESINIPEQRVQQILDDANMALNLLSDSMARNYVTSGILTRASFGRVNWVDIGHAITKTSLNTSQTTSYSNYVSERQDAVSMRVIPNDVLQDAYELTSLPMSEIRRRIPRANGIDISNPDTYRHNTELTRIVNLVTGELLHVNDAVQIAVDESRESDRRRRQEINTVRRARRQASVAEQPSVTGNTSSNNQESAQPLESVPQADTQPDLDDGRKTDGFITLIEKAKNTDRPEYLETVTDGGRDFTFGIELECKHRTDSEFGDRLARRLYEEGLSTYSNMLGWRGNRRSGYQTFTVEYDSSVARSGGYGVEIVTPPLQDTPEDWAKVKRITEIIEELGGETDNDCGSHVHVGCSQFGNSPEKYHYVAKLFGSMQGGMYKLATVGESHRGTTYARPYQNSQLESATSMQYVRENMNRRSNRNNRRAGLNFARSGSENSSTIEGRIFDGTVNIHTIQRNVALMAGLIQTAEDDIASGKSSGDIEGFQTARTLNRASESRMMDSLDNVLSLLSSKKMKEQVARAWFKGNE